LDVENIDEREGTDLLRDKLKMTSRNSIEESTQFDVDESGMSNT
jgi:hypothetical protein